MRDCLTLFALTFIVGFSVDQFGGVTAREWNFVLIALCLLSLVAFIPGAQPSVPALSSASSLLVTFVFVYVAFQLLPLPAEWIRILSPNRFEIVHGLALFHGGSSGAITRGAISVSPQLTFAHLLRLFAYLLVFFLSRDLSFRFATRIWLMTLPLVIMGAIESSIVLAQHFEGIANAAGTYVNHGHMAGFLEMILPLTLVFIPVIPHRAKRALRASAGAASSMFILVCLAVLILLGLLYTGSRMSLAAAGIPIAGLAVLEARGRHRQSAIILIAAAGLMLLLFSAPVSLVTRYEGGLTSEGRFQIWRATLTLIARYPVFGCGLGTFVSAVQKYRPALPLELIDFAHNDYLQLLAELGAAGFLLVTALAVRAAGVTRGIIRHESSRVAHLIAMGCVASITAIALHSAVDFQFDLPANMMVAAWIAGVIAGIGAKGGEIRENSGTESVFTASNARI